MHSEGSWVRIPPGAPNQRFASVVVWHDLFPSKLNIHTAPHGDNPQPSPGTNQGLGTNAPIVPMLCPSTLFAAIFDHYPDAYGFVHRAIAAGLIRTHR